MTVQSHDNACMHSLSAQVSGEHEARYEFKSVEYAVMCAENKLAQPLAVIAAGSGSAQVTAFDTFFSFEAQLRIGAEMVSAASDRAEGIRLWQEYVRAQARKAQGNQVQNPLFTPPVPGVQSAPLTTGSAHRVRTYAKRGFHHGRCLIFSRRRRATRRQSPARRRFAWWVSPPTSTARSRRGSTGVKT